MAKLKDLTVKYISLVKSPATGKGLTLKSLDCEARRETTFAIDKTDDERMVAYGIVYAPDEVDSHGDSADAETIRKAAYEFMRDQRLKNIDANHSSQPEDAYVAESWIVRAGDALFPAERPGSWAVGIRVGDPALWRQLKSGELTGLSLAGTARVKHRSDTTADRMPGWFERFLKSITPGGDNPMTTQTTDADRLKTLVDECLATALSPKSETDRGPDEIDNKITVVVEEKIKAVAAGLEKAIDERLAKALARGETEADTPSETVEESYA
ncbi:MAG: XkdF-like putative serine protease domain-containing protein [Hyphomicrobiales bacterium]